jgi:hypothetical protein
MSGDGRGDGEVRIFRRREDQEGERGSVGHSGNVFGSAIFL